MKIVELEQIDGTDDYMRGKMLKQLQTLLDQTNDTYNILFQHQHPVYTTHLIKRYNQLLSKTEKQHPVELLFREITTINENYGTIDKSEWILPSLKLNIASLIAFLEYEVLWNQSSHHILSPKRSKNIRQRHKRLQQEHVSLKREYEGIKRMK